MRKGHWEISFKEIAGYNDYESKTMNEVIEKLIKSTYFQDFEVTKIEYVED